MLGSSSKHGSLLLGRSEVSSEGKDAIKFDEYMEDGIPDSLLKGLGFSETGLPCADESSEQEIEAESSEEEEQGVAMDESEEENLDEDYRPSRKGKCLNAKIF